MASLSGICVVAAGPDAPARIARAGIQLEDIRPGPGNLWLDVGGEDALEVARAVSDAMPLSWRSWAESRGSSGVLLVRTVQDRGSIGAATRIAMASSMRTASVRCSDILTVMSRTATSRRCGRGWHCTRTYAGGARDARIAACVRTQPGRRDQTAAAWLSTPPPPGDGVLSGDRRPSRDHAARRTRSVAPWLRVAASRRGWLPSLARLRHRGTGLRARRVPVVSVRDPRPVQLQGPRPVPVLRWQADGGWCG